ncbi:hypothetical protein [Amaricoccus solimangrovi]|uniref:Phage tail protein n=1 Tax=Amaricoccus solimangrovi TaxID=2589815 RepID=A0A501WZN7_9RHOB|nr:hypothetical protein [Amaricoccus solimangrovi]TPE52591.1 hypothetical protein FJM51_05275 [Amaricoccus solimangrovi]
MSDILTHARAHYGRMRDQTIEIPEWSAEDGAPLVVHFSPLTLRQRQKLNARAGTDNPGRLMALAVILFARDAEGKPLLEDTAPTLAALEGEVAPVVIARIAGAMLGTTEADELGN